MQVVCKYYEAECESLPRMYHTVQMKHASQIQDIIIIISQQFISVFQVFCLCQFQDLATIVDMS